MDLSTLNRFSEKEKCAEKHLRKFVSEIQRHFDFSDLQIGKLLYNVFLKFKKKEPPLKNLINLLLKQLQK